jgi:hypothetical protein
MPGQGLEEKKMVKSDEMVDRLYRIQLVDIYGVKHDMIVSCEDAINLVDNINCFEQPEK